jgi:flagellar hook-basal body complex protein FliE
MAPIIPANLSIPSMPSLAGIASGTSAGGSAFQSVLSDAISKVESFQNDATSSVDKFLSGEGEELHESRSRHAAGRLIVPAFHAGAQ